MNTKIFWYLLTITMTSFSLVACGGDDDDNGSGSSSSSSGLTGYYIRQDMKGFWLDLVSDDTTFKLNSEGEIIGVTTWPWGETSEQNMSGGSSDIVYYIPDNETFIKYCAGYYKENAPAAGNKTLLYRFNYGNLGTLALYAKYTYYYTYWREGNKLYTTEDGMTIYTITSSGLIPDGSSFLYSKYDPDTVY